MCVLVLEEGGVKLQWYVGKTLGGGAKRCCIGNGQIRDGQAGQEI